MTRYKVVGQCAHVKTMTESGRMTRLLYKGNLVPADAPPEQIRHLLSVGLIRPVAGVSAPEPVASVGAAGDPAGAGEPELSEERKDARGKLKPDGSAPHANAAEAVWVEYAVAKGYDYDAAKAAGKAELIKLLKG